MLKYKCVDCQKEFKIDYSSYIKGLNPEYQKNIDEAKTEEETNELIKKYVEGTIPFKFEKNYCLECLKQILAKNDKESREKEEALNSLRANEKTINFDINAIEADQQNENIELIEQEEEEAFNALSDVKQKMNANMENLDTILGELNLINKDEKTSWRKFNDFEKQITLATKESVYNKITHSNLQSKIKTFSQTSIFTDLFQISFSGKVATINSCRMQLPVSGNNYDELNAGWGYIVFLTAILAKKFEFDSRKYRLEPNGSYSRIRDESGNTYDLSYSELSRTLPNFNKAMSVFLEYFDEFVKHINAKGIVKKFGENKGITACDFTFVIKKDTINDKSIIFDNNRGNEWCQCMKYLLAELKMIVTMALMDEDEKYKNILEIANVINPYHKFE